MSLTLADGGAVAVTGALALGADWNITGADLGDGGFGDAAISCHLAEMAGHPHRTGSTRKCSRPGRGCAPSGSKPLTEKARITDINGSITLSDARLELGRKIRPLPILMGGRRLPKIAARSS